MRDTPLPLLAVLGFVLVVLLFTADEALEILAQASTQTRVVATALASHVTSEPVNAAQPRVAPEHPMRVEASALAVRAEVPHTKKRVTRTQPPAEYRQNNGSSHRGAASIRRMSRAHPNAVLVHTPVNASWLNQVEVYFSLLQRKVLEQCTAPSLVVADTMDHWIRSEPDQLRDLLRRIDGLVLNDSEAKLLTNDENLVRAGNTVRKMGPKFVVIKKGEHGAMFFSQHETYVLPAYPTPRVVDPTGAGDSFGGGMMGYLAQRGCFDPKTLMVESCNGWTYDDMRREWEYMLEFGGKCERLHHGPNWLGFTTPNGTSRAR